MNIKNTENYKLIDCGEFKKLEQVGSLKIVRPAASAFWRKQNPEKWKSMDWEFERSDSGKGQWKNISSQKFEKISLQCGPIKLFIKATPFGHMGLFAEQIPYWKKIIKSCQEHGQPMKVLNLFAYTGGSTIAAALGGAEVVHVDASKTSIDWAKENAQLNGLEEAPIRWMLDDVSAFIKREIRRENKYQGIILDPPSYGRGTKNQLWKIEEDLPDLIEKLKLLLSEDFSFFHLSAHTPGLSALGLENLLKSIFGNDFQFITEEMYIPVETGTTLPSGTSCWMIRK
ncbi:MAG: class I SAM-dependent methyltransferase [Bdellovibrionaceae bacterium]|nr:class I SAM-dependent methyltransferase [Pseudobdellovibrionaceae bacterium]